MSGDGGEHIPGIPLANVSEHRRTRSLVAGNALGVKETVNVTVYKQASGLVIKSGVIYFGVRPANTSGKYNISVNWNVTIGSYGVSTEFTLNP